MSVEEGTHRHTKINSSLIVVPSGKPEEGGGESSNGRGSKIMSVFSARQLLRKSMAVKTMCYSVFRAKI